MGATGLSTDANEYRSRLDGQEDTQIDAWVSELMRDVVIRRGIVKVVDDFRRSARLSEPRIRTGVRFRRRPARLARPRRRRTPGRPRPSRCGRSSPGSARRCRTRRQRLIEYLVANFNELVYV